LLQREYVGEVHTDVVRSRLAQRSERGEREGEREALCGWLYLVGRGRVTSPFALSCMVVWVQSKHAGNVAVDIARLRSDATDVVVSGRCCVSGCALLVAVA
jgi:hypothetical protein